MRTTLYKNTAKSSRMWSCETSGSSLCVTWGDTYGKQTTVEDVFPSNSEAEKEALRRINKKKDREGYSEDPRAKAPLLPMLSHKYGEYGYQLPSEVLVQPKLDGYRCVGNKSMLLSRKNTIFNSVPHILERIKKLPENAELDGELYIPGLPFQEISKVVMRDHPHRKMGLVEFHIFDVQRKGPYTARLEYLDWLIPDNEQYLKKVPTETKTTDELHATLLASVAAGYEGIMVKDPRGVYEYDTRSTTTQKMKPHMAGRFKVVGFKTSEQGREKGRAIALCETEDGQEFPCRLAYDDYMARHIWKNRDSYRRAYAVVDFAGYFASGLPRQPRCRQLVQGAMPKSKGPSQWDS